MDFEGLGWATQFLSLQGLSVAFRITIIYLGESMGLVIIRVIQKGEVYGFES